MAWFSIMKRGEFELQTLFHNNFSKRQRSSPISVTPQKRYLHSKVPGHELADRLESSKGRSNSKTTESRLRDGGIDNTLGTKLVQKTLGDLYSDVARRHHVLVLCQVTAISSIIWCIYGSKLPFSHMVIREWELLFALINFEPCHPKMSYY